jgi:formylmethanofuran:tetrahydromethanopterin formyltransferase
MHPNFFEVFDGLGASLLITGPNLDYLKHIACEFCASFGIPFGKSEAGITQYVIHGPDGRYGIVCSMWVKGIEESSKQIFQKELKRRFQQTLLQKIGIRIFSVTPNPDFFLKASEIGQPFSFIYGYEIDDYGRIMYNIPRMGGDLQIESQIGVHNGIMGACTLILFESEIDGINLEPELRQICLNDKNVTLINGFIASGSVLETVGNKIIAISNGPFCPSLKTKYPTENQVPLGIQCILEIILNAYYRNDLIDELKKVWQFLLSKSVIKEIFPANFNGKLGNYKIELSELACKEQRNEK